MISEGQNICDFSVWTLDHEYFTHLATLPAVQAVTTNWLNITTNILPLKMTRYTLLNFEGQ